MNLVANMDYQEGDDADIVFDFNKAEVDHDKEAIKRALNEYINERLREVAVDFKVPEASSD